MVKQQRRTCHFSCVYIYDIVYNRSACSKEESCMRIVLLIIGWFRRNTKTVSTAKRREKESIEEEDEDFSAEMDSYVNKRFKDSFPFDKHDRPFQ